MNDQIKKVMNKARVFAVQGGALSLQAFSHTRAVTMRARETLKKKPDVTKAPWPLRFSAQEQMYFSKRLAMLLRAGIPILEALSMLEEQAHSHSSRYIFHALAQNVARGAPLSAGLKKFEKLFGEFAVNIVKIGEVSGTLNENLNYLAEELKKGESLKKKVVGALVYPAVIVVATLGITLMLTLYIFPKITPIFQSFRTGLPLSTKILIAVSGFLIHDGLWLVLAIVACVVAFSFARRNATFRLHTDMYMLRLPFFGQLMQYYNLANISRTLGLLLRTDVRVVTALEVVADSSKNRAYRAALKRAEENIVTGKKLSSQFSVDPKLFPPIFAQMVMVGESTGNLSGGLGFCAEMYEEEIDDLTKNLTSILEPALMIFMGILVGFIAISIITPIYGITSQLHG